MWPSGSGVGHAHEASGGSFVTVTGQTLQMQAFEQSTASQAGQAYQIRDTAAELASVRQQAAQEQGAKKASTKKPAAKKHPAKKHAASGSPQQIAAAMLGSFGWSSGQFSCLDPLWAHESGWSTTAYNSGSGAYGIPQALPGSRMASAGPDWQTNAATQIRWGLEYIKGTYGSPCAAWDHEQATGWY